MNNSVVLPLEEDLLWDIIENGQKQKLIVNVAQSYAALKDKLLYYISNTELDVEFDWTDCDFDIKSSVIESYINLNRMYENSELIQTVFDLMMCYKGIDAEVRGIFNVNELVDFINNHLELFSKLVPFVDSVFLVVCNGFAPIADAFKPELFEQVHDNSLSVNVVYLFMMPEFAAYYGVLDFNNLKWYTTQFNDPIYNNDSLHNIVFENTSGLAAVIYAVMIEQGLINEQDLKEEDK